MLRLPYAWAAARRSCLRTFSTGTSTPNDALEDILNGIERDPSSPAPNDEVSRFPPLGPAGALPPGGPILQPASKLQDEHGTPIEKPDRKYHLHVFTSRNNTIMTFTDAVGNPRTMISAGSCGFKNVQRSGYEAGYQCAVKMFSIIAKERGNQPMTMKLEVLFNGFGNGREAFYRALMTTEGDGIRDAVFRITDTTPMKIGGGTRAKKARRL